VRTKIILLVTLALLFSACGSAPEPADATPVPSTETAAPALPAATATSVVPLAVLIVPPTLDPETSDLYQKTVYDLAQSAGMRFQVRDELTPADLEPGLKVVIAFPPDPGIAALAAAAPEVQFLSINIPDVAPGGNVSVLGGSSQSDIAGFLAGYTAALITDDYRIGMMMPRDNPDAIRAFNSYVNGMKFYCGLCRPYFFFAWSFPQFIDIPASEDRNNYDAYSDILISQYRVRTIYLYPDIAIPELVDYIGTTGVLMIGARTPEQLPAGWVMTIQPDIVKAIQNAWSSLINGQGGLTVQSPLGLSDIDPSLLTPGKQRLVEQTLQELQAGLIAP
jgi:hypothetical protein